MSSKQQQVAPQGPWRVPEQQGSQNREKKCHHAIQDWGWCWDGKQSALADRRPMSCPPECSVCLSDRARGRTQVVPQAGRKWPKITKNGPRCLPGAPQKVLLSRLMDKINLGTVWVAFWPCLDLCGTETVSVGPKIGSFGPPMCHAG